MQNRQILKKIFFQPKSLVLIFIALAALMVASALVELNHSKKELLDLMKKQAHTLLETVLISSNNALLTYEHLEMFLDERLLNNAGFVKYLYENHKVNNRFLKKFAQDNNIYRINIISPDGRKIFSSHELHPDIKSGKTASQKILMPIFRGLRDTLIIGYKEANFEEGMRYAVALAAKDRSAIVVNLDAEELLNFRKKIGFGSLLKNITNNPGIVYIALQDSLGIIAASGNVRELERIEDSPFLARALTDSSYHVRFTRFNSTEVFEAIHPFYYGSIPVGLFRLGLSLEPLNQIKTRIYRRIAIITVILMVVGFIVFTFIMVRQNYNLLQKQYQVVETYSANIIRHVSDAIIVLDTNKKIKIFNQAAETLFGKKVNEVLGKTLSHLISDSMCEKRNNADNL